MFAVPSFPGRVAERGVIRQRAIGPFGVLRAEKMGVGGLRRGVDQALGSIAGQPDARRQLIADAGARAVRVVEGDDGAVPNDDALRPAGPAGQHHAKDGTPQRVGNGLHGAIEPGQLTGKCPPVKDDDLARRFVRRHRNA